MTRAVAYLRISSDPEGTRAGVTRQEEDCRKLATELGWDITAIYCDNDTSAFKGKKRPEFERMVAGIKAQQIDAVVAYSVDRLTRRPVELEEIITLHERHGVLLATCSGKINLGTTDGRMMARVTGAFARSEVERMSDRIKRAATARAETGKVHGRSAWGWTRVGTRDEIVPEQAELIRDMTKKLLAGYSLRSITNELNERGIPSPGGALWQAVIVRQTLLRAKNAGLRTYQGKVIGTGDWDPIISVEDYDRIVALLADPARRKSRSNAHKYLLSGIATCGPCGNILRVNIGKTSNAYICMNCFKVKRRLDKMDNLVTKVIVGRLAMPDAQTLFIEPEDKGLAIEAEKVRERLNLAADQFADEIIDGIQLARITSRLRPRLAELDRVTKKTMPDLLDLVRPDIAEVWDDVPLERKRAVINYLLEVKLYPSGRGSRDDVETIQVTWRERVSPQM